MGEAADTRAIFVDTSVQILRIIGSKGHKTRIRERLDKYGLIVTSLVVRQEFNRRFLTEMRYLIEQLDRRDSLPDLLHHLNQGLGPFHRRKAVICIAIVTTFLERQVFSESTEEQRDRFRVYLEMLLEGGLDDFDEMVHHVIEESDCAAGRISIRRKGSRYDFGHEKCSRHPNCKIQAMLLEKVAAVTALQSALEALPKPAPTNELESARNFFEKVAKDPECVRGCEPCLKVGDAIIAVKSAGIPSFYTKNYKESRHLAPALGQTLIVRPNREDLDDIVCAPGEPITVFGNK
jgi:hypothetical protein